MVPGISLLQILPENDFLPKSRKEHKPNLSLFFVLVRKTALFAAKISSSEKVAKQDGRSMNIS